MFGLFFQVKLLNISRILRDIIWVESKYFCIIILRKFRLKHHSIIFVCKLMIQNTHTYQ